MVSAVQVATMAPMFLLTVPAGALADVADARRLLVAAQAGVVAVGALFASLVTAHSETPSALLLTTFLRDRGARRAGVADHHSDARDQARARRRHRYQ